MTFKIRTDKLKKKKFKKVLDIYNYCDINNTYDDD